MSLNIAFEDPKPAAKYKYVNAGRFGSIRVLEGTMKTVHSDSLLHRQELLREFEIGQDIHKVLSHQAPHYFYTPFYLAYGSQAASSADSEDVFVGSTDIPVMIREAIMNAPRTTFALDYIPPLPQAVIESFRQLTSCQAEEIRILRLYFGRTPGSSNTAIQLPVETDRPLTMNIYEAIRAKLADVVSMPSVENVCRAMGNVLGRVHWGAGINGRDAELCLAGDGSGGVRLVFFDFNMCTRWIIRNPLLSPADDPNDLTVGTHAENDLATGAKRLAIMISSVEAYYPRPHQGRPYEMFAAGYREGVDEVLATYVPTAEDPSRPTPLVLINAVKGAVDDFSSHTNWRIQRDWRDTVAERED